MTDAEKTAENERRGLNAMFVMMAVARRTALEAERDARYAAAADAIRQIAATLHMIGDDVLLKLSSVNIHSEGVLSELIAARLTEIGFALPLCKSAKEFFEPIEATVDAILQRARPHTH